MYHPWGALGRLRSWTLLFSPLPAGIWGRTSHQNRTIILAPGLTQAQRRTTLAHELEHVHRGPVPVEQRALEREETACDVAAARKLIGIRELGEALAWAHHLDEAADELWVDRPMLDVRLAHLHPSERHYLRRRLTHDTIEDENDAEGGGVGQPQ